METQKFNFNMFMCKLDRLAAWILLVVMLLYGVTGYGMTKGIIDRQFATSLHLGYLGGIGLVAFLIHVGWAVHLAFCRWGIWNKMTKYILLFLGLVVTIFFLYAQYVYQPVLIKNNTKTILSNKDVSPAISKTPVEPVTSFVPTQKVFTAQTLSQYNGTNGQPSYVAVDGVVYDMSTTFRRGNHAGYSAGQDLSTAFHDKHPGSYLNGLEVVGVYK